MVLQLHETLCMRRGGIFSVARAFLHACSWVYGAGQYCAHRYIACTRKVHPRPFTISIGNITAGGSGKTPLVILLGEKMQAKHTAVLVRAYHGSCRSDCLQVDPTADAFYAGDEAVLLSQALPMCSVYATQNKPNAIYAINKTDAAILLLDDGFQQYKIHRDANILVMNGYNPFGYHHLLPLGLLREPLSAISRADLIVLNHADKLADPAHFESTVRQYTSANIVCVSPAFSGLFSLDGQPFVPHTQQVALFCGIGTPQGFIDLVQKCGYTVVTTHCIADHCTVSPEKLLAFWLAAEAQGASCILTTEKDSVKLCATALKTVPIGVVRMRLSVLSGGEYLDDLARKALK